MPPRSRCALLILCSAACAHGQTTPPQTARNLHIAKVSTPPALDEYLSGVGPAGVTAITGFLQRNPDDGKPASSETKAWLTYDDENLYVVFVCKSRPGEVRAR